MPGGSLQSKPIWSNAFGCSAMSAFYVLCRVTTATRVNQAKWRERIASNRLQR